MRGQQSNVIIIVAIVWLSPMTAMRSAYTSHHPIDSLLPALIAEAKYCLLHDDGDEAIVVVPHHVSSVAVALFVAHHPRHHHPCHPHPLLHHRRYRSPATLVTVAITLAALFVPALIIGHALSLFVVTRSHACVHRWPSTLPLLVDCCLFTPTVAATAITVDVAVAFATTITTTEAIVFTNDTVNAVSINTAAAAAIAADAAIVATAVIIIVTNNGRPRRRPRHGPRHSCQRQHQHQR